MQADDCPNNSNTAFLREHRSSLERYVESGRMTSKDADSCSKITLQYMEERGRGNAEIEWEGVEPLRGETKIDLTGGMATLDPHEASKLLDKVVVLRLNGGLGTSMGCSGPKALIKVKHDESFLDLVVRQVVALGASHGVHLPLVFMNSDRTDKLTRKSISEIQSKLKTEGKQEADISFFLQPVFPRLDPETLLPSAALEEINEDELWYPPGHASVFPSFINSGLARKFRQEGKKWVFVANVDNLGAWPDPRILYMIEKSRASIQLEKDTEQPPIFFMETTHKTQLDVKGGAPVTYHKKPYLLEAVQVPSGHQKDFEDISRFELFNTGNLWIDLDAWLHFPPLELPIIPNPKTINLPSGSVKVLQLETGIGTALGVLPSNVLIVPRSRFIPVKLTSDLLRLRSDVYEIDTKTGFVKSNSSTLPIIRLSSEFSHVKDLEERVKGNVSLKDVKMLSLDGNIILEDGVKFIGDVEIHSHTEQPLELSTIYVDAKIE